MCSATTTPSDDHPTPFTLQTYDLSLSGHRYHHLSVLWVRSDLNLLLMWIEVCSLKYLSVLEHLVCNCCYLLAWLGLLLCYHLISVMSMLLTCLVCHLLLTSVALGPMVRIITHSYWAYSCIYRVLGRATVGNF